MPWKDPEKKKQYMKQYCEKNKEKRKQYMKQYWEKNKKKINVYKKPKEKQYREKNKEAINLQQRQWYQKNRDEQLARTRAYQQTPKYLKYRRIKDWNYQGIIFHDMDLLHDIYEQTTHCDNCNVFLQGKGNARKCLDHDHSICDDENVRNVLCNRCNLTRGD